MVAAYHEKLTNNEDGFISLTLPVWFDTSGNPRPPDAGLPIFSEVAASSVKTYAVLHESNFEPRRAMAPGGGREDTESGHPARRRDHDRAPDHHIRQRLVQVESSPTRM